jgi:hypothetical protein
MNTDTWGTHTFTYLRNKRYYLKERDNKFAAKCPVCGMTWGELSSAYWGNGKVIKNCNDYIIKSIIE